MKVLTFQEIVTFIRNQFNNSNEFISLHSPVFSGNEKKYLNECIDSTYVSSIGKFVDRFEEVVANYTGASKAVACMNGTNALHLALLLSGVKQDDEVITQPLTFVATANAIAYCGAHPVFVDVDLDTLGMSPKSLGEWLEENVIFASQPQPQPYNKTTGRRIKACVPMHTFGFPCRIDEIVDICNKYGIAVVEDAAESIGSFYKGKLTGTFGNIGVLSFNGNKTITTGGGGMLLFSDENLAQRAKHLSTQAKIPHAWEFDHDDIGYNYRMPNINAALGLAQMEQLDPFLKEKRELADRYRIFFKDSEFTYISEIQNAKANYWLNTILFKDLKERDEFLKYSNDLNVMTRPAWKLMNRLPMFKDAQCGELSNAIWISDRLVNIPSSIILNR